MQTNRDDKQNQVFDALLGSLLSERAEQETVELMERYAGDAPTATSPEFEKRMAAILRSAERPARRRFRGRVIFLVAAIIVLLAALATFTVSANRANLYNFFFGETRAKINIRDLVGYDLYARAQEELGDIPLYVPGDKVFASQEPAITISTLTDNAAYVEVEYQLPEGRLICNQITPPVGYQGMDNENGSIEKVDLNGYDGYFRADGNDVTIHYSTETTTFFINATGIGRDEALAFAKQLRAFLLD